MKKEYFTLLAAVIFLMANCTGRHGRMNDGLTVVDVNETYQTIKLKLQDIMDVEYVQLETNDEFVTALSFRKLGII